jgi:hypothetical protein
MKKIFIITMLGLLIAACDSDSPLTVQDSDLFYTVFDHQYDFKMKHTYAMPDKIASGVVRSVYNDTTIEYMDPLFTSTILQAIERNMQAYGWTRVNIEKKPDLLLMPAGLSATTIFSSWWYEWWYRGFGRYWGWDGWYYPPHFTISSYESGTLLLVLADPRQGGESRIIGAPALWIAAANGLLTYRHDLPRVASGIDRAFARSPYLDNN